MRKKCIAALLLFTCFPAHANTLYFENYFSIHGEKFGGNEMVRFELVSTDQDGDTSTKEEPLMGGEGLVIGAGYGARYSNYQLKVNVGFKYNAVDGENGRSSFVRYPLEMLIFYRIAEHGFGGGLTRHMFPLFSCKIEDICDSEVSFKDSNGIIFEYNYVFKDNPRNDLGMVFGVRYLILNYELENSGPKLSGNAIGGIIGVVF